MEDLCRKFLLLQDRVGANVERSILSLGLSTKQVPTQVLRGELLEALPEAEQPQDSSKIALGGVERKSLRLECALDCIMRLTEEDANLLLAITSLEERYQTYMDRIRLDFGKKIRQGSRVFVTVKGISKKLPGVVWYKGELPSSNGTMFGVELIEHQGLGTSDGTFRNQWYFTCAPDSGVFVGLDKLTPRDDSDLKYQKKGESVNIASRIKVTVIPSFMKGKNEPDLSQDGMKDRFSIGDRVVTFVKGDCPVRGTVRYIGNHKDRNGKIQTILGLELDTMDGEGTGKLQNKQIFVCRRNFAHFSSIHGVIPEKDFDDKNCDLSKPRGISEDKNKTQEQICRDEESAKSLGHNFPRSAGTACTKRVRRASSADDSASVIQAAGESSSTDTAAFIEQQRQILLEVKSSKSPALNDGDVDMQDHERTDSGSNLNFQEEHFRSTSQNGAPRENMPIPITKQPSLSTGHPSQMYADFVNIEHEDYKKQAGPHEDGRYAMHSSHGIDTRTPLATTAVSDCNRGTSNKPEDDILLKEHEKNLEGQTSALHMEKLAADNTTGADAAGQSAVDNPHGFEVGTMVEVPMAGVPRYGVIKWIGALPQVKDKLVAGLELEDEQSACSDGTFNGERYFTCPAGRGFFTLLLHCRPDSRFTHISTGSQDNGVSGKAFGSLPSPDVPGITEPPATLEDHHCGTMHGLQGHHNSCYLDASLYSMFAFSSVFDTLLHRQKRDTDLPEYERVQLVLRESIVNPLRAHGFVRADKVLELRELLDKLSSTAGLVNEEKDPEEFLNSLLQQVLKADPFLHLKSRDVHKKDSEGAFFYQIITDKDESVKIAQVQQLLEQSFISADIILSEVPSCLILQMPRFGSRYKLYDMILPNLKLDVTNIVENVPRECSMCGSEVAQFECTSCFQQRRFGSESGIASYCRGCNDTVHSHRHRQDHEQRPLLIPRQYDSKRLLEKQTMELFAVVCIETSHYVAFVKCGVGAKAAWCFFDSMADRKGESNGYNIPAVTRCPEALEWLTKDPKDILAANERGEIPEKVQRLLGDGYLCMYQNLDMTMYKSPETSPSHFRERQQTLPSLLEQLREGREREVNVIRQLRQAEEQKDSSRRQLMRSKEELENCQQQLRNKEEQLRGKEQEQENLQRQLSEMVQRLANSQEQVQDSQRQMMEMEQRLTNCQEQLQEREARLENSQRQMREMEQRLTNCQEQLQEREARLENSQRQVREMEQRLTNCLEQLQEREARLENSQRQMREMEQRLTNCLEQFHEREAGLLEQLRENEQQQENSQRRVREIEQRLTNCQEQLQEREARLQNSQRQVREMEQRLVNFERYVTENEAERVNLERQLVVKDQEINELETSLSAAQQTISELRRQETCDWVIARDEIQIKDKCLGKGGWGSVNEGTYCGCVVAVKQIHELILSPHNRRLFEREMNIASRCRHPCLLQFIGATNDEGSPLFVTELMETSLRALLEQRELSEAEICVISLDVARALNYLHQRRPSPILHRDVSSANVLLWRRGDQWRGKVSDYGTAKFVQQTMTVAPGALIYSSPEALSSNQTAMVDVYSFGVLLCEMCIRELPDPERRDEQVVLVSNRMFRGLVRRCLETDPLMRPDMAQIIQELEQFNDTMS